MDRRSPEIIPVLELTSNALLLQAAPSKRRWVIIFKTMLPLIYDYLNCFSPEKKLAHLIQLTYIDK